MAGNGPLKSAEDQVRCSGHRHQRHPAQTMQGRQRQQVSEYALGVSATIATAVGSMSPPRAVIYILGRYQPAFGKPASRAARRWRARSQHAGGCSRWNPSIVFPTYSFVLNTHMKLWFFLAWRWAASTRGACRAGSARTSPGPSCPSEVPSRRHRCGCCWRPDSISSSHFTNSSPFGLRILAPSPMPSSYNCMISRAFPHTSFRVAVVRLECARAAPGRERKGGRRRRHQR